MKNLPLLLKKIGINVLSSLEVWFEYHFVLILPISLIFEVTPVIISQEVASILLFFDRTSNIWVTSAEMFFPWDVSGIFGCWTIWEYISYDMDIIFQLYSVYFLIFLSKSSFRPFLQPFWIKIASWFVSCNTTSLCFFSVFTNQFHWIYFQGLNRVSLKD